MPGVRKALFQKLYILVVMAGELIGYIQTNDTHFHRQFKASHRKKENELMLKKLQAPNRKLYHPVKGKFLGMTLSKRKKVDVNFPVVLKQLFVTPKLNRREDYPIIDTY